MRQIVISCSWSQRFSPGLKVGPSMKDRCHIGPHYNQSVEKTADLTQSPDMRLAIYGTLAPGRVNHHQISKLAGTWQRGTVKGNLFPAGWGAAQGFPGLILDPHAASVDVDLFESIDLPDHWARLDKFEGPGYRRVVTKVNTKEGARSAWIYVLTDEDAPPLSRDQ